jgi:hypothetical protein
MNRIFSLFKVLFLAFIFFVGFSVASAHAAGGNVGNCKYNTNNTVTCTCPATNGAPCYINAYSCKANNVSNSCTEVVLEANKPLAAGSTYTSTAPSCGTIQVDLGGLKAGSAFSAGWVWASMSCPTAATNTCPASDGYAGTVDRAGNTCLDGFCVAGKYTQSGCANKIWCARANLGCGLNNHMVNCSPTQMAVCNGVSGAVTCQNSTACTNTAPPDSPVGGWGSCGNCNTGNIPACANTTAEMSSTVCRKADGSYNHPLGQSMPNDSGVCVWNPAGCGSNGGGGATPTPAPRTCGQSCSKTSDCLNPSGGGFPVECRNGTCQLPLTGPYACPEGKSSGSICGCSAQQLCGQPCGPAVGNKLCAPGSVCGFITPSNACMVNGVQQTAKQYCLPVNPQGGYALKRCDVEPAINYIAANSLVKPGGSQVGLTVADAVAACKSVCGDGIIGVGEVCDAGKDNGTPGSMCDATCKPNVVCGDTCNNNAGCNKHLVTLRCDIPAGKSYCGFDALIENGVTLQENNARFTKPGNWRVSTAKELSGGTEVYASDKGATISFLTSSQEVTLIQTKAANRGVFTVLIDGKEQPAKIDQSSATSLFRQSQVISLRSTAVPDYVCASNVCRLASNPNSTTCGGGPTPTPVPPTPSALVCDLNVSWTSNANPDAWKFGDMITFTVAPAPSSRIPTGGSIRYEGQVASYRGTTNVQSITLTPISAGASKFQPMKVERANSTYYFRFRYCVKTSAGVETCSNWGSWQVPS